MSIKRSIFDTVVILAFLTTTGLLFNFISGSQLSNPLIGNTVQAEEQV